jgi:hypothetical protein
VPHSSLFEGCGFWSTRRRPGPIPPRATAAAS